MKNDFSPLRFVLLAIVAICSITASPQNVDDTDTFSSFFSQQQVSGVDYIMSLFDDADIVVLAERDHREMTQYDFILSLISDSRFIDNVGAVYTEVGCYGRTEAANELLNADVPDSLFRHRLLDYLMLEDWWPFWEKTNRSVFLSSLHDINVTQAKDNPIFLGLTDTDFDWDSVKTAEDWGKYLDNDFSTSRDSIMASHFTKLYETQPLRNGCRKALIITNAPHAILDGSEITEGAWLKERYGNKLKVVMLNWNYWWKNDEGARKLWADGVPDSAFKALEITPIGFDIVGSPFASLLYYREKSMTDVADGMIWDKSYFDWIYSIGVEGIADDAVRLQELNRRQNIVQLIMNPEWPEITPEQTAAYFGTVRRWGNSQE